MVPNLRVLISSITMITANTQGATMKVEMYNTLTI